MRILVLILAGLTLLSCGGKTRSSSTEIKVVPDEPIVISADRKRGDVTDKGPWYQYNLQITNNDESLPITIAAIKVTVSGADENGSLQTKTGAHSAGEFNTAGTDNTPECKFDYFKSIAVGETALLSVDNGNAACKGIALMIDTDGPGGQNLKNYRYRVRVELIGWFGEATDPQDRFQTTYNFTAR